MHRTACSGLVRPDMPLAGLIPEECDGAMEIGKNAFALSAAAD